MLFGIYAFPRDRSEAEAAAGLAELYGFESLGTGDHIRHPRIPEDPVMDGWSLVAAWAAMTQRVRIGVFVTNLIYRDPVLLAKQATTVDQLSNGRLDLGLGTGVYETDHLMSGVEIWSPAERVARLGEALNIVDGLLRGRLDSYQGRFYTFEHAAVSPRPFQSPRPPLTVAAEGPRMLRLAAEHADRWMTFGGFADAEEIEAKTRSRISALRQACVEFGRDPEALRRALFVFPPLEPWASADGFRDLVDRYTRIGVEEFFFPIPRDDQMSAFENVAADVLPDYRTNTERLDE